MPRFLVLASGCLSGLIGLSAAGAPGWAQTAPSRNSPSAKTGTGDAATPSQKGPAKPATPARPDDRRAPAAKASSGKQKDTAARAGGPAQSTAAGRAGKDAKDQTPARRVSVPLAPTREEVERQAAAQRRAKEAAADEAHASRGRLPTQVGNTAGPSSNQGSNTSDQRKAATLEASGPEPYR